MLRDNYNATVFPKACTVPDFQITPPMVLPGFGSTAYIEFDMRNMQLISMIQIEYFGGTSDYPFYKFSVGITDYSYDECNGVYFQMLTSADDNNIVVSVSCTKYGRYIRISSTTFIDICSIQVIGENGE